MYILGFAGGLDQAYGSLNRRTDPRFHFHKNELHDSSAALLKDGEVIAAIEEERLSRIKHTNSRPVRAIKFCLETAGIRLHDLSAIAYPCTERSMTRLLWKFNLQHPDVQPFWSIRDRLAHIFEQEFGAEIPANKFRFVEHHVAHAMSAYCASGFEESLVVTLDGQGEGLAGTVFDGRRGRLHRLLNIPSRDSLGLLYERVIAFLGYLEYDEYKVMGLAPYGDPARYRHLMKRLYRLGPDGAFSIQSGEIGALQEVGLPRRKGQPFTQEHKDLAAALQESLEEIVLHHLAHYQRVTEHRHLCLAGGVAHNCSMNGVIRTSGIFEDIFIQPAAHDGGCALGAAYAIHQEMDPHRPLTRMTHVYSGSGVPDPDELDALLRGWHLFVTVEKLDDAPLEAARLLAEGNVIGWAQGRSEFGPRALGNRSILADPRPEENKTRINAMVKKREAYRPFAPSVLEEYAHQYFAVPEGSQFPFMIMTVNVREDKRDELRAITHVNGSARVHTVNREINPAYWKLIEHFRTLTGVPVVLNTSFNNNVEPIVESVHDAMTTFLTTTLDALIVGDFLIRRKRVPLETALQLRPALPDHVELIQSDVYVPGRGRQIRRLLRRANTIDDQVEISESAYRFLSGCQTGAAADAASGAWSASLANEIWSLWELRLISLAPEADGGRESSPCGNASHATDGVCSRYETK